MGVVDSYWMKLFDKMYDWAYITNTVGKENSKELALKAISKSKYSLEEIAELYDLTLDEVKELANGKSA